MLFWSRSIDFLHFVLKLLRGWWVNWTMSSEKVKEYSSEPSASSKHASHRTSSSLFSSMHFHRFSLSTIMSRIRWLTAGQYTGQNYRCETWSDFNLIHAGLGIPAMTAKPGIMFKCSDKHCPTICVRCCSGNEFVSIHWLCRLSAHQSS